MEGNNDLTRRRSHNRPWHDADNKAPTVRNNDKEHTERRSRSQERTRKLRQINTDLVSEHSPTRASPAATTSNRLSPSPTATTSNRMSPSARPPAMSSSAAARKKRLAESKANFPPSRSMSMQPSTNTQSLETMSSRELRARRLRLEGAPSSLDNSNHSLGSVVNENSNAHYTAHSPHVEKYLMRNQFMHNLRDQRENKSSPTLSSGGLPTSPTDSTGGRPPSVISATTRPSSAGRYSSSSSNRLSPTSASAVSSSSSSRQYNDTASNRSRASYTDTRTLHDRADLNSSNSSGRRERKFSANNSVTSVSIGTDTSQNTEKTSHVKRATSSRSSSRNSPTNTQQQIKRTGSTEDAADAQQRKQFLQQNADRDPRVSGKRSVSIQQAPKSAPLPTIDKETQQLSASPTIVDATVRGWSTYSQRRKSLETESTKNASPDASNDSKVSRYLQMRYAQKMGVTSTGVDDNNSGTAVTQSALADTTKQARLAAAIEYENGNEDENNNKTASESDSETDSDVLDTESASLSSESDDDEGNEGSSDTGPEYSVRVCVVSAVDLPASMVPNLPMSPLLKVGLVTLPSHNSNPQGEDEGSQRSIDEERCKEIASTIESKGINAIPKSRVKCTSSKVLSKRDSGSVEFHEELRWDNVKNPYNVGIALELSARAVITPSNIKESPPAQDVQPIQFSASSPSATSSLGRGVARNHSTDVNGNKLGALFRRPQKMAEMETANAAAAVAKHLMEGGEKGGSSSSRSVHTRSSPVAADDKTTNAKNANAGNQTEVDVKLRRRKRKRRYKMTEDIRLGSQIVPLSRLQLSKALNGVDKVRIEQWFELESNTTTNTTPATLARTMSSRGLLTGPASTSVSTTRRNPSVLLEISFCTPEALDDSEDEMVEDDGRAEELNASFAKRASAKIRNQLARETNASEEREQEPVLEPGVVDFVCVVGARDIGNQTSDDGAVGWVNSTPECCILEQFPPTDEFHQSKGRMTALPNKVEWFCFPEGCRVWRGSTPPNAEELSLKRFSASSPSSISSSFAMFDAFLGCTTSFTWFVIASNSDEYGSESSKTYGACVKFYVPAPPGIDPTQDDFAQAVLGSALRDQDPQRNRKRLWVPLGICVTSSLPIVGVLETVLLRMCDSLSAKGICTSASSIPSFVDLYEDITSMILTYQRPIPGIVNCSVPFLKGDRLHLSISPRNSLPPLPHGNAISSVCRLLGAEGISYLLAAFLTECKILLHSDDPSNLCMVAEVMTSLLYPFSWSLPYVPVLPAEMMEFIEAPLSYLLGIPSCNLSLLDPTILEDIVVVDLDRDFSVNDYYQETRFNAPSKTPVPLPATVAGNISKAVYRLLRNEEENDQSLPSSVLGGSLNCPRLGPENAAEREFRLSVALEVCGLVRGYNECLVYASSTHPAFNVEKFMQIAPILFEEQRGTAAAQGQSMQATTRQVISPRSRRFMTLFVNCQHFHQFLESFDKNQLAFFHEVMASLNTIGPKKDLMSVEYLQTLDHLNKLLQQLDDKVPVFRIERTLKELTVDMKGDEIGMVEYLKFPVDLLRPIQIDTPLESVGSSDSSVGVKHVSLEYLVELEKNPWQYRDIFNCRLNDYLDQCPLSGSYKLKLREAIGERRYRAWKMSFDQERYDCDDTSILSDDSNKRLLDFTGLMKSSIADSSSHNSSTTAVVDPQKKIADAKDRDVLRRCLQKVGESGSTKSGLSHDRGRDLVSEAEVALRNPSARRFLISALSKRNEENSKVDDMSPRRKSVVSGSIKLNNNMFDVLVRLGCAMLDACMEDREYDTAYALLKNTAGLCTSHDSDDKAMMTFMSGRLGLHPIYADVGLWERVKEVNFESRQDTKDADGTDKSRDRADEEDDEYESAVATLYEMLGYGIPAEDLARFASRVAEQNGWFMSDRGQALLLFARRLCVRREQGEEAGSTKSDIDLISPKPGLAKQSTLVTHKTIGSPRGYTANIRGEVSAKWVETSWCHPAAKSVKRISTNSDSNRRTGTQNLLNMLEETKISSTQPKSSNLLRRSAVTSMAYLSSSMVVTGGLDGSVFIARTSSDTTNDERNINVRGIHLDWGSSGSRYTVGSTGASLDGEYGVGAVNCLATTSGMQHSYNQLRSNTADKGTRDAMTEDELLSDMEGSRIVAGTTCGDLRVWSVKDVLSAVFYANNSSADPTDGGWSSQDSRAYNKASEGMSSTYASGRRRNGPDYTTGSSLTRLKFSLRGRALSGHRGGVSCIDVPSNIYRPDSVVSGGADGLIKLWSLRAPTAATGRKKEGENTTTLIKSTTAADAISPRAKSSRSGDALSILSGHGGRVLCVKTAWHGDRLLSGGADRTVRVWDLAGSGGKCLNSLSGHLGWVTSVHFWGPNTIISASTDRSVALWDTRVRNSPLFSLRHHYAPVSSVLVGSRTDPTMISAASDGTVAVWDFRRLNNGSSSKNLQEETDRSQNKCHISRHPAARFYMHDYASRRHVYGPVLLSRGANVRGRTVYCTGGDAVIREWDILSGDVVSEHNTGHCDTISSFHSLQGEKLCGSELDEQPVTGTITTSWDGTIRMRRQLVN